MGRGRPVSMATAASPRTCRILYYGPAGGGKSANLLQIGASVPGPFRVPAPTGSRGERFAFRLDAGELGPWVVSVDAADPFAEAAAGRPAAEPFPFDGIVFVADSAADRLDDNLSALEALKIHLEGSGLDMASLPLVIQYNKRDVPGSLPLDGLESLLNPWGVPSFAAVAERGEGVRETLRAALGLILKQLTQGEQGAEEPAEPDAAEAAGEPADAGSDEARAAETTETAWPASAPEPAAAAVAAPAAADARTLVVPLTLPRSLLEGGGPLRLVLQLTVADAPPDDR